MRMLLGALALLLVVALAQPARAQTPRWPAAWDATPSADVVREARAAATEFGVPLLLLFALGYVESRFDVKARGKLHGGNTERFAKSWATYRGRTIGDSSIKWGDKFKAADWRPVTWLQTLPYHVWGVVLPADAPLADALTARVGARAGARFLRDARKAGGSWLAAITAYNSKPAFRDLVLAAYRALGGNVAALKGATS